MARVPEFQTMLDGTIVKEHSVVMENGMFKMSDNLCGGRTSHAMAKT